MTRYIIIKDNHIMAIIQFIDVHKSHKGATLKTYFIERQLWDPKFYLIEDSWVGSETVKKRSKRRYEKDWKRKKEERKWKLKNFI